MALFNTFITTPSVMAVYKPARGVSARIHRKLCDLSAGGCELRILGCVHGSGNVPSLISLVDSTRSTKSSSLKLFAVHLVELTEQPSSIVMVHRARKNGFPWFRFRNGEWHAQMVGAFQSYSHLGRVRVRPTTTISSLSTMHEDVCHVAEAKRVAMIILQFGGDDMGRGWRVVNRRVLESAPCSVAVLVDRGFGASGAHATGPIVDAAQQICVIFSGGPDAREALELGRRMAEHPAVKVTVVRFRPDEGVEGDDVILQPMPSESEDNGYNYFSSLINWEKEKELDDIAMAEFRTKWGGTVEYIEKEARDIVEGVVTIGQEGGYDLIVVGRGRFPSTMVAKLPDRPAEHVELGPIGDILADPNRGIVSSVLVIQQYEGEARAEETPVVK